jgi:60 kDa SS-A/Ro ribonucleoprotein
VREVVDALDAAFDLAFGNVEATGKRLLLALDVSGSMAGGSVAGVPGLTPRDASAALALVTTATEERYEIVGFFAARGGWKAGGRRQFDLGADGLSPLAISPRQRLDDAVKALDELPFGGTDCALPMLYALAREREVDTFVIYTDSENLGGRRPPGLGARGLPPRVGHRRPAGGRGHGLERLLDRRPERPGNARRRGLRHRDAAADLGLRPRRALTRGAPQAPPASAPVPDRKERR